MSAIPKSSDNASSSSSASKQPGRHLHLLRSIDKQTNESPFFSGKGKKGSFFQPRLTVGSKDDPYEREADKTAEEVTQTIHPGKGEGFFTPSPPTSGSSPPGLNRSGFFQRKPAFESPSEMDLNTASNRQIQRSTLKINTLEDSERESAEAANTVQTFSGSGNNGRSREVNPEIEQGIQSSRGGGEPLDKSTQSKMEPAFGADFSGVRVHTDANAGNMNKQISAQAFTAGNHIYFNEGKYNPGTKEGDSLIAHELTHTVQQGSVTIQTKVNNYSRAPGLTIQKKGWVQRKIEAGLNWAAERLIPGYTLLNVILGKNIITDEPVARTGVNLIEGFMDLTPVIGKILFNELKETNTLTEAGIWVEKQITRFGINFDDIARRLTLMWDEMSIWKGVEGNVKIFSKYFGKLIYKITAFTNVVMEKVKELRFEGALRLVGAYELLASLKKNKAALKRTIDNPKLILKFFMKALKEGFANFKKNFATHFKNALFGWLFGKAAEMGVEIPKKFDVPNLFHFVAQLVGGTYRQIRATVVEKLGTNGEKIVSYMEKTVSFITALVTEGPVAMWNKVKTSLSNLKEMIFSQVTTLVITEIIKQAVFKLVSILNPAGAIIQLVLGIYRVIKFFIDWWETIKEIATAVLNAIVKVALGNTMGAALFIEKIMAKGMKLVIAFLANIFGLGGIVSKVKILIQKISKPVREAIKRVIGWIIKKGRSLLKKGKSKAKKAVETLVKWWKARKSFKSTDGKKHTLYFKGSEKNSRLMIASAPQTFTEFIDSLKTNDANKKTKDKALAIAKLIDKKKLAPTGAATNEQTRKNKEKKKKELENLLTELSPHTAILLGIKTKDLPDTEVQFDTTTKGGALMAKQMTAKILTKKGPNGSSPTSAKHDVFDKLLLRKEGNRSYYIRGHLLNDNLHGPGQWKNMTPLSQAGNKNHLISAESPIKKAVASGAIIRYTVTPLYNRSVTVPTKATLKSSGIEESNWEDIIKVREAEKHVPTGLDLKADMLEIKPDGTYKTKKYVSKQVVDNKVDTNLTNYEVTKGKAKERVSITNDSVVKIFENTSNLSKDNIQLVQKYAQKVDGLRNYQQIKDKINASRLANNKKKALSPVVDALQKQKNVVLV